MEVTRFIAEVCITMCRPWRSDYIFRGCSVLLTIAVRLPAAAVDLRAAHSTTHRTIPLYRPYSHVGTSDSRLGWRRNLSESILLRLLGNHWLACCVFPVQGLSLLMPKGIRVWRSPASKESWLSGGAAADWRRARRVPYREDASLTYRALYVKYVRYCRCHTLVTSMDEN